MANKVPPLDPGAALEVTIDTFVTVLGHASVVCEAHHALVVQAEGLRKAARALRQAAETSRRENRSIRAIRA